jgi:beta-glucosidase
MYVWQGGQEGGHGVLDVLTGRVNPCGKLTDTIAFDIKDYPSSKYFGDKLKNYYKEDIYVGYRYFETFAKERVQYPFGFGLSYTEFTNTASIREITNQSVEIVGKVVNVGKHAGKEVIQVYVKAPQGKLDKPFRAFVGFYKTEVIQPGESEEYVISCPKSYFASYDDSGVTGNKSCFILEEGSYKIYVGSDVRSASCCGIWNEDEIILEQLEEACAPAESFDRFKLRRTTSGEYQLEKELVPTRTYGVYDRIDQYRENEIPYTGDMGYCLGDVYNKKITMNEFLAQLSDEDLMCLFRGEGMCSLKVTPGTAGAFGGLTPSLRKFGIPVACCADGPSGIRMDCGTKAFSLPNGTALGCTYNMELVKELFQMLGLELRRNKIDTILGPGINIHRNPLNGRNFEYVSEDPVLSGKICEAQLKGMHSVGVTGTLKHFCANNQEEERYSVEAVVSERALREIYLKGFEIAVKEGDAKSFMTTYGPVNGIWTAGYFDLCTIILREQWKYNGIVMTDWWANGNWEGEPGDKCNRAPMVIAQNDLYMCCADALEEESVDNVKENLENGVIKRFDLQRNAKNILNFIMNSPVMLRELGIATDEIENEENDENDESLPEIMQHFEVESLNNTLVIDKNMIDFSYDTMQFAIIVANEGEYQIAIEASSKLGQLAQLPISVYMDNIYRTTISFQGTEGKMVKKSSKLGNVLGRNHYIKLVLQTKGIEINSIKISM